MQKAQNAVRKRVAMELLSTEKSYVNSLRVMCEQLVAPLKDQVRDSGGDAFGCMLCYYVLM